MRIGIEACTWANRRGYGRFTRGLVTAMVDRFPEHEFVLLVDQVTAATCTFPSRARLAVVTTSEQPTEAAGAGGARRPVDLLRMARGAAREPVDVFVFPSHYSYFPLLRRVATVVVFHDATDVEHPELLFPDRRARLLWRLKCRLARWQADRLCTVSEDARRQLARAYRAPPESIHVVTEGPDPVFGRCTDRAAAEATRARLGLPAETALVLYVGGISPHKNLARLLEAMARRADDPGWHLVLVGDVSGDSFLGCHRDLVGRARALGLDERVTFTGFVPDADLAHLYHVARLLVLPSMNEGFGLPVVEAMASDLAVAVSDRGSLPEVVGDAGLLFDPEDAGDIARAVGALLDDEATRAGCVARGRARAARYSWEASAARMMSLLEELAGAR